MQEKEHQLLQLGSTRKTSTQTISGTVLKSDMQTTPFPPHTKSGQIWIFIPKDVQFLILFG